MEKQDNHDTLQPLPPCAADYIAQVVRKVRYKKKVRWDIAAELTAHFEDELQNCTTEAERNAKARRLIEGFGDPKLLAVLCRRAKKRCRPLWKKVVVRSMQACGVFLLYLIICMVPLLIGKPTIKMDYVQWLNDTVRGNHEESENAWPYYEKAAELSIEMPEVVGMAPFWPGDMNDAELEALRPWLAQNAAALDLLREGSQRPYCWNKYKADMTDFPDMTDSPDSVQYLMCLPPEATITGVMGNAMPQCSRFRQLASMLQRRILLEIYDGHADAAMNDCLVLARLGDHLLTQALLIEQMSGVSIEWMADGSLLWLVKEVNLPQDALATMQQRWQERLDRSGAGIHFDSDKGLWEDRIQQSFTDDGEGGGRPLMQGFPYWITGDVGRDLRTFLTFHTPDRHEIQAEVNAHYAEMEKLLVQPPWQWTHQKTDANETDAAILKSELSLRNLQGPQRLISVLQRETGVHPRAAELGWLRRVRGTAVVTVLALKRYRTERGQYPDDLQQLVVAGYLRELPRDPFAPGPLTYKKTDDDFLLYSWDDDLMDNGGRPVVRKTDWRARPDPGDLVFWPVPRSRN